MRHADDEEEFFEMKSQLATVEKERDNAFDELREIKRKMNNYEVNRLKDSLLNANKELRNKDDTIDSLKAKLKQLESNLEEKHASLHKAVEELSAVTYTTYQNQSLLSDTKKRIEELEAEVERRKESERKLLESFLQQKSQLEQASSLLEKSNLDVSLLREKMQEKERVNSHMVVDNEVPIETKILLDEIHVLKKELRLAMEAEETSNKAMDDLALALSEVAEESKEAKEKLKYTEEQLEESIVEVENLKMMVKSTEQTFEVLLTEAMKENETLKNKIDRLRLETEESLLAWNQKEIEFVKCIKEADDEKAAAQEEIDRLKELTSTASRDETRKLRDILKQALNEANVAKEAASLARAENHQLQDSLAEKDRVLATLTQEADRFGMYETEANESIMESERIIAVAGSHKKDVAKSENEIKEHEKATAKKEKDPTIIECIEKEQQREKKASSSFRFDLNQLWHARAGNHKANKDVDGDNPETDDVLVDSIFDVVKPPKVELKAHGSAPTSRYRRTTSVYSNEGNNYSFENFDESQHFDDIDMDRTSHGKTKALLRRFGDLLGRKNVNHKKDVSKDLPHQPKDVPKDLPKELPQPSEKDIQV